MHHPKSRYLIELSNAISNQEQQFRYWQINRMDSINIICANFLNTICNSDSYLVIGAKYGIMCDGFLDLKRDFLLINFDESDIQFYSKDVRKKFKIADISSKSLDLGLFDCTVCVDTDLTKYDLSTSQFLANHSKRFIIFGLGIYHDINFVNTMSQLLSEYGFNRNTEKEKYWKESLLTILPKEYRDYITIFEREWIDPNKDIGKEIEEN